MCSCVDTGTPHTGTTNVNKFTLVFILTACFSACEEMMVGSPPPHVENLTVWEWGVRGEADASPVISGVLLCNPTVPPEGRADASSSALPHTVSVAQGLHTATFSLGD